MHKDSQSGTRQTEWGIKKEKQSRCLPARDNSKQISLVVKGGHEPGISETTKSCPKNSTLLSSQQIHHKLIFTTFLLPFTSLVFQSAVTPMQAQITGLEEGKINDSYLLQFVILFCGGFLRGSIRCSQN